MYQKLYRKLFNAITDALAAIQQKNYGIAADILTRVQIDAEELYLSASESDIAAADKEQPDIP